MEALEKRELLAMFSITGGGSVNEGNSTNPANYVDLPFTVMATNVMGSSSVQYRTLTTGTATPGNDFVATSGTLTFTTNGQQTINVKIRGDVTPEPNETVVVEIFNPLPASPPPGSTITTPTATKPSPTTISRRSPWVTPASSREIPAQLTPCSR